jgi:hypothetical protein
MISLTGKIVAPQGEKYYRREIFGNKGECDKLPFDLYPITHIDNPEGEGATLIHGDLKCEVSFHRYEKNTHYFYIGSARRRLKSQDYTERFRRFLEKVGVAEKGARVNLEFDANKIYVSKITNA